MRVTGWRWPDRIHNPAAFLRFRLVRLPERPAQPIRAAACSRLAGTVTCCPLFLRYGTSWPVLCQRVLARRVLACRHGIPQVQASGVGLPCLRLGPSMRIWWLVLTNRSSRDSATTGLGKRRVTDGHGCLPIRGGLCCGSWGGWPLDEGLGDAAGVGGTELVGAAQAPPRTSSRAGRGLLGGMFGAGDQDALDGAIGRVADSDGASAGGF